jgi:hypothetical protein
LADFTFDEQQKIFGELGQLDQKRASYASTASPVLAKTTADFYRVAPDLDPSILLPTAQAVANGSMSYEQGIKFAQDANAKFLKEQAAQKSGGGDTGPMGWLNSKLKTASRWTFSALNFVPQVVTNVASQLYQEIPGTKLQDGAAAGQGWFISTDLGSLVANDEEAGSGWFVGGKALEAQAQRAKDYRGTIDGKAFTLGRGTAAFVAQPGSREYNILSGVVDAAAALAVPSIPGVKYIKEGATFLESQAGLRTLAGLTNFESAAIDVNKVTGFINSTSGRKVVERISEVTSIAEAKQLFPKADAIFWRDVTDAKTVGEVKNMLSDSLGVKRGLQNTADINISRWDDVKNGIVGRSSTIQKWMANMPGQHVVISDGNIQDITKSVDNVDNYLKLIKVDETTRVGLVDKFTRGLIDNPYDMKNTVDEFNEVLNTSLVSMGVPEEAAKELIASYKEITDYSYFGAVDAHGDATTFGTMALDATDATVRDAPLYTAALQSEMLRHSMMLPDPRRVRRMTGPMRMLFGKDTVLKLDPEQYGKSRLPFAMLESLQNDLWKPFTLMTGGYVMRNMSDSLLRQSLAPGVKTGIFHPIELIQTAIFKKFRGDIEGVLFDQDIESLIRNGNQELVDATQVQIRERMNPVVLEARGKQTGAWQIVRKSNETRYGYGVADQIHLLANDAIARKYAEGLSTDEIIDWIKTDKEGIQYAKSLQARWSNRSMTNLADGTKSVATVNFVDANGVIHENNMRQFIDEYIGKRVEAETGGNQMLKEIVATGYFTDAAGNKVSAFTNAGAVNIGYEQSFLDEIYNLVRDPANQLPETVKTRTRIDPKKVSMGRGKGNRDDLIKSYDNTVNKFFGALYPKSEAFLNRSPVFRQQYYNKIDELMSQLSPDEAKNMLGTLRQVGKKELVNTQKKLTAYKKLLPDSGGSYKIEGELVSKRKYNRILADLESTIKKNPEQFTDEWLIKYVGSSKLADKIKGYADGTIVSKGEYTLNDISSVAKGFALDETQRLFYNAAEQSNFADIFRIVAPFGSAWAEVMSSWSKMLVQDPQNLRKVGVSIQGLKNADPDGNGQGFFYKDPQTGEYVFNYPFSSNFSPFITGLTGAFTGALGGGLTGAAVGGTVGAIGGQVLQTQLGGINPVFVAPAKSLNMGFQVIPGVGPFAQMAADKIIPNIPQTDWVRKLLTPYGAPEMTIVPAWAQKVIEAVSGDPDSARKLGDLTMDTMKALSTTGQYDLSIASERERIQNDATDKARILLTLQGIGQFLGPSRPSVEFKITTKDGDVMANELSKTFTSYRSENYDTAVSRFLDTFGNDAFLYMEGKTKSVSGGLDASTAFGNWESANPSVMARYKDVAGYFAPVGANFDYQVYMRQIETGNRERLKPSELVEEAQALVAKALYRQVTREVGSKPSEEQTAWLRSYRDKLKVQLPGFATAVVDINRIPGLISSVETAAQDTLLDNNPVAEAARAYFEARNQALVEAQNRGYVGITGKNTSDLRQWLANFADTLTLKYPEFQRLYDRLLYNELDL